MNEWTIVTIAFMVSLRWSSTMVVRLWDSSGVQRGNATCMARFQKKLPEKRRVFIHCKSSCADICLIDCDRICNPTIASVLSEDDGIAEDEQDIWLATHQTQKIEVDFKTASGRWLSRNLHSSMSATWQKWVRVQHPWLCWVSIPCWMKKAWSHSRTIMLTNGDTFSMLQARYS